MSEKSRPWWKSVPEGSASAAQRAPAPPAQSEEEEDAEEASAVETGGLVIVAPLADLVDGESRNVPDKPYVMRNVAGVYSCTCPAWQHLGVAIERRSCKHLRAFRGAAAEEARVGVRAVPGATRTAGGATAAGTAPPLLLAHTWENDVDLTGWWMSEKLDGVRAYWDGENLVSRLGNVFVAPAWFTAGLPKDKKLDGELFSGRKKFQRTVSIVRRQDRGEAWREIQYLLFDVPSHQAPFEERLLVIDSIVAEANLAHVKAHPHAHCPSAAHLREELARVEALGGEGLMMRRPGSRYEVGRSHTLLKVKTFKDAEARVVGHQPGAGKHKGRLGALACELADGTKFSVGTGLSDRERETPPPIGSIITFRYQELSNDGVPRFPSYVGVRDDADFPAAAAAPAAAPAARAPAAAPARVAPAPAAAPTPAPASTATRDARVFVRDGVTWEITLRGASHTIRRQRGEAVEAVTASFTGAALAWRDAERKIAERVAEGFTEIAPD